MSRKLGAPDAIKRFTAFEHQAFHAAPAAFVAQRGERVPIAARSTSGDTRSKSTPVFAQRARDVIELRAAFEQRRTRQSRPLTSSKS